MLLLMMMLIIAWMIIAKTTLNAPRRTATASTSPPRDATPRRRHRRRRRHRARDCRRTTRRTHKSDKKTPRATPHVRLHDPPAAARIRTQSTAIALVALVALSARVLRTFTRPCARASCVRWHRCHVGYGIFRDRASALCGVVYAYCIPLRCCDMVFYVACHAHACATCTYSMGTYADDRVMRMRARRVTRTAARIARARARDIAPRVVPLIVEVRRTCARASCSPSRLAAAAVVRRRVSRGEDDEGASRGPTASENEPRAHRVDDDDDDDDDDDGCVYARARYITPYLSRVLAHRTRARTHRAHRRSAIRRH